MLDYPDETYEHAAVSRQALLEAENEFGALIRSYDAGKIFREGAVAAVTGRTNSGKSTLFNLLLKEDRSIVSAEHGTTRDFIEGAITVSGIPIRLFDTAGLREAAHKIEEEGIRRTRLVLESADLVIYLVDASAGISPEDEIFLESGTGGRPVVKLWTKVDVNNASAPAGFIPFSAVSQRGFPELEAAIRRTLLGDSATAGGESRIPLIDSLRQKEALSQAQAAVEHARRGLEKNASYDLLAADLREAVDELGKITGEVSSADVLEIVFSKFCIGK